MHFKFKFHYFFISNIIKSSKLQKNLWEETKNPIPHRGHYSEVLLYSKQS